MTKLLLSSALAVCLALPALAVQPAEGERLADDQSYTFRLSDAIRSADPHHNTDAEGSDILRQLFEGLFTEDDRGALQPGAATHYDLSDDRLTYTFHLRPDAKWSNGDPVTAGDFVFAWRRLADPATGSESARHLERMNIEHAAAVIKGDLQPQELGVSATDDHTLRVKLSTPTPQFPKMLIHSSTFPLNQKVIEAEGDAWTQPGKLVGNGAFILTGHELGTRITMQKNPAYRDADSVVLEHLTGLGITDTETALTLYKAGDLDRTTIPSDRVSQLSQEHPGQAVSLPVPCTYGFLINLGPKGPAPLKDIRVRQALSLAMQRETVVEQILQSGQRPAFTWTHWATEGFEMPAIAHPEWTREARLDRAKDLLAEAGYGPDNPLKLKLNYNTDEIHGLVAAAARQFYDEIGVELTPESLDWQTHSDRLQSGDFELARYAWCADYNEASGFLDFFGRQGRNYGHFLNADYDRLLADARTSENPDARYSEAESILVREVPVVPVYHYARTDLINPSIRGLPRENMTGGWYAKNIYSIAP